MDSSNDQSISLNKYISATGICSRREADKWIDAGRVKINDVVAKKGNRVFGGDEVLLDGNLLSTKPKPLYLAFNKPVGIVCTTDRKEPKNIVDYINHPQRLFPIGRLDKPSEGLIFMTNDGDIVNKILRAGNRHEKEYIVTVDKKITTDFIHKMSNGIPILDTVTKKCTVEKLADYTFKIILTQGLNRQIRRMCNYLDYRVQRLRRTRIMHVRIGALAIGQWRALTADEERILMDTVKHSSKTEEASRDPKSRKPKL